MSVSRWLNSWMPGTNRAATPRRRPARLQLESLEGRVCPSYTVVDLGTLGGAASEARSINEASQVVGRSLTATGETHAFLWQNSLMTDLGTLGTTASAANDINDNTQVVGTIGIAADLRAFLWQDGAMTAIGGNGSQANAINNAGQIVGTASGAAVVWEGGVMYDLNSLLTDVQGVRVYRAFNINDNHQIVAEGTIAAPWGDEWHPFLLTDDDGVWANGGAVLTDLPVWMGYGEGRGLNNSGQVVGQTNDAEGWSNATLYIHGDMCDIGEYATPTYANAINDAGKIVGRFHPNSHNYQPHAVIWENQVRIDLNDRIGSDTGWTLQSADAINQRGEIVGYGSISNQKRAFLLTESSLPLVAIAGDNVTEGNTGTTAAVFTVSLSAPSVEIVTIAYSTASGSTADGSDYQGVAGTLTFNPGETSKTITVLVNGDVRDEFDETFVVRLSSPTNALISISEAQAIILDDDESPSMTINDLSFAEGNATTTIATVTVSLSATSGKSMFVNFATVDGTASSAGDYTAASGTLMIPAGQTTGTITILVTGDRRGEPNETFFVNLSSPTNATIADGQAVGTIVDDEPRISISDVTKTEGKKGQTTLFTFTVTLSAAYDQAVTMSYSTVNATATTGNGDYIAKTGTLTFAPGETTKTITIEVKGDSKRETNETFYLDLFGLSNNALFTKNRGLGTILNDD